MNNEAEKTADTQDHAGPDDTPPIAEPVESQGGDDRTPLASADAQGQELSAGDQTEQVVDSSLDPQAGAAAAHDAEQSLKSEAGMQSADATSAASDDTVMDEVDMAALEAAEAEIDDTPEPVVPAGPIELNEPEDEEISLAWYILKVQSNRERSISEALRRKIAIEGLDNLFGQVLVPTEKVTEFKGGKKKVVERKLWPGYIAVEMHVNDDTWFAIRETSGIGDFTGSAGKPTPMSPEEIAKILHTEEEEADEAPKLDIKFSPGDKVKVMEGNFENFEGEVSGIDETHGRVTVMLSIFGRPTPVELEYWQVEGV